MDIIVIIIIFFFKRTECINANFIFCIKSNFAMLILSFSNILKKLFI